MTAKEFKPKSPIIGVIVVIVGSLVFLISNPPWNTPSSLAAIHSVLGLLAISTTSATLIRVRMDPSPSHRMLLSAMGFISILHFGAALVNLYFTKRVVAHTTPHGVFMDIVEMFLIGFLIFLAAYLKQIDLKAESIWNHKYTTMGMLVCTFSIYAFCFYLSETIIIESIFVIAGYVAGIFSLVLFSLAIIFFNKQPVGSFSHNTVRLMISCGFFVLTTIVLLFILPQPSSLWLLTISLQSGAFMFIIIGTAYPYLVDVGINPKLAYAYVISLLAFALLPFVLAQYFEEAVPLIYIRDLSATMYIHSGASILFGVMGYLLHIKSKRGGSWHYEPVILSLYSWALVEISIVLSHLLPIYGETAESFIPYIVGSVISVFLQAVATKRILSPPKDDESPLSFITILLVLCFTVFSIVAGEIIRWQLIASVPELYTTNYGEMLMLTLNYFMAFNMINFILLLTTETGGEISIELVTTGSQSLWIISIILKSNFSDWTSGWWAAESVMLIGVIGLPFLLTYLYTREEKYAQTYLDRTTIYSDFIAKDVQSYHQSALDSLGRLSMDSAFGDKSLDAISHILSDISLADELTRGIGVLLKEERFKPDDLDPIDLVDCVSFTFYRVATSIDEKYVEFGFQYETGKYFVKANELLVLMFYNLFNEIIKRLSGEIKFVIMIHTPQSPEMTYQLEIKIRVSPDEAKQNHALLKRYLEGERLGPLEFGLVKRLLQLFGGSIYIEDYNPSDFPSEIKFMLNLPATEEA